MEKSAKPGLVLPDPQLTAGLGEHPVADREDQFAVFQHIDE